MRITKTLGWVAILLSILILLIFATIRLRDMSQGSTASDTFGVRYVHHPWISLLHIIPGLLFLTLGPLQFVGRIRRRRIGLHRGLGRILAPCAALSGIFALLSAFWLPAFGGINTQSATVFFGLIFLFSLVKAVVHIRWKEVDLHREWMIRTFALAMGVASIRVFIGLFVALTSFSISEIFGTSFWLGLGVNLMIAEVWIQYSRKSNNTT